MKYTDALGIKTGKQLLEMETEWYIEKKGWKLTYVLPNVTPTLYEKELDGKRVTLRIEDAFTYELAVEEPRGYEY